MAETWTATASRKQKERLARIPQQWLLPFAYSAEAGAENILDAPRSCGILTAQELRMTEAFDATALVAEMANGRMKSEDVTRAFCKRAAIAQQLTNCLTEIFFEDGISRARQLDEHLRKTGKPIGPLHGLPISLKDTFHVKGYDSSLGIASLCYQPAKHNSVLVDLLLSQGAVLFCKTNIPQTLAALDSHNNVFGRVLNPANRLLTAGGSTGGEGALLAMRGSPLGVGTDIGGSIRIPAMCNGLVGFKPSHGRTPYAGQQNVPYPGSNKVGIEATAGPLATSVRDCQLFMRVVCANALQSEDPDVLPQTWEQQSSLQRTPSTAAPPLRVGIARWDGHVQPLPPINNLMDDIARALGSPRLPTWVAIEVVDIDIRNIASQCVKTFNGVMSIDGGNAWFDQLDKTGEPLSPWLQNRLKRRPAKTLDEVRTIQAQKAALQTQFLDIWRESGGYWSTEASQQKTGNRELDVFLFPIAPHPTPPIDRWNSTNYTSAFNLLDAAAGVLPVRRVTAADLECEMTSDRVLNGWDKINQELWTHVVRNVYLGTMMGVQVVAPKLMERRLMEAMAVLEEALAPLGHKAMSKL